MSRRFGGFARPALLIAAVFLSGPSLIHAADSAKDTVSKPDLPKDPKALKTYNSALEFQKQRSISAAIDEFRKANKQDGGQCAACLERAYTLAASIRDFKSAEAIARDWLVLSASDAEKALAHYRIGVALQQQGIDGKKRKCFEESCDELKDALQVEPKFPVAHYSLGISLAHLHQDDAARQEFVAFLDEDKANLLYHQRAERYKDRIELARSRMAPAFSVTTMDGQRVTMDSLAGKVVLIDFWATWCPSCVEALPHMRQIAKQFQGQPFVVLSVSLDKDADKWKNFVNKNEMTWLQYRDGGWDGDIAKLFGVTAIPATFTIDADGVLEDQHVGDAGIEGKLKKLIARANEVASQKSATQAAVSAPASH